MNQQMPVSETGALTIWRHPSILAGIGRLEHPRAVLGTAVLPVKLYPCMMMVMPAGFEPSITSLRGLRPNQLDEGTRWRYGSDSNRRLTALQAVLFNLLSTVSWLGYCMAFSNSTKNCYFFAISYNCKKTDTDYINSANKRYCFAFLFALTRARARNGKTYTARVETNRASMKRIAARAGVSRGTGIGCCLL